MFSILTAADAAPTSTGSAIDALGVGREAAFSALHADAASPLWRFLFRTCGDRSLADDLVQESFLRLLRKPQVLDDLSIARPYLYRIAANLLRDRWRHQRRHDRLAPPVPANQTASHARSSRLQADVQAVLEKLSPRERSLIWLAHVDGYRHDEIAQILNLSRLSTRVLLHRAKKKLLRLLEKQGYAPENL